MKSAPLGLLNLFVTTLWLAASSHLPAQTSTWVGNAITTAADWNSGANWDTGVAPNSPAVTAVLHIDRVLDSYSLGDVRLWSSSVDLAELRLVVDLPGVPNPWAPPVVLTGPISFPASGSTLNLYGAGLAIENNGSTGPSLRVNVGMGSHLNFHNAATISGPGVHIGFDNPYSGFSGNVDFYDQSSAGDATILLQGSGVGNVTFHDQSSAAQSSIQADNLTFADHATAGDAHINTYAFGSTVLFRDQASAGNAFIRTARYGTIIFEDRASAGTATVSIGMEAGGVIIRDQADTSGLTIIGRTTSGDLGGGRLDISGAAGGVTLRGLDGGIQALLGANTLTLGPATDDQTLAGTISGTGGLILDTGRVANITNSGNTYTGPTEVRSGTLNLASGRVSATTVAASAELTGQGTIAGDLLNHGTLRPLLSAHDSPLTVQGDFTQTESGTLTVRLVSSGSFDQLAVAGSATLDGTLVLSTYESLPSVGNTRYDFLTADSIVGTFTSVAGMPSDTAMLHYRLVYTAQDVALEVAQQSFAAIATTPAQRALGAHLDATLDAATDGYRSILLLLNTRPAAAEVVAGLNRLVPDRYSVLSEDSFATAATLQSALDRRLAALRQPSAAGPLRSTAFFTGGQRRTTYTAVDGLDEATFKSNSGLAGFVWSRDHWTLGAAIVSAQSAADLDHFGSRAQVRSIAPGLFSQYTSGAFFVHAAASHSRDRYTLLRDCSLVGLSARATARPDGSRTDLALTAGYDFARGNWTVTPFFGLLSSRFKVDDFTETLEAGNPGAEMTITDWSVRSLRSRTGFDLAYHSPSGALVPHLTVTWLHEIEQSRGFSARFASTPPASAYYAPGRPGESDIVQASLGLERQFTHQFGLSFNAGFARGQNFRTTADLSASFHWVF